MDSMNYCDGNVYDDWEEDEHGLKYRKIGNGIVEHEMTIMVEGGVEIPVSQLEEYHRRMKETADKRRAEKLEEMRSRPVPKKCPFSSGMSNLCNREKCVLFIGGECSIAAIADAYGASVTEKEPKKCPFSVYARCEGCAMNNGGCAFVRLAASAIHK